jgi:hypothetical protein
VDIEDHEVGRRLVQLLEALDPIAGLDDLAVGVFEQKRDELTDLLLVIDDKREGQVASSFTRLVPCAGD